MTDKKLIIKTPYFQVEASNQNGFINATLTLVTYKIYAFFTSNRLVWKTLFRKIGNDLNLFMHLQ